MHASLKTCCKDREAFVLCNRCFLCEEAAESASHLLIKCGQSTQIYVGWNGQCHLSLNMRNLLECRQHQRVDIRAKEIWRTIPSCIMWMGFDITDYPVQSAMTTVYPMPYYLNDPKNVGIQ
ncbi:hypothetical protein KY285_016723 [Solanum tuberosum]|nr:hypothetical protein KY284_016717 [Solanum tuberosum]KAH0689569.1 hypothetical protein KY289_016927 [Solanum tuberosum]KAH0702445.1 hypothetical protein KY285_016723 [Solanum tuberosum]